MASLGRTWTQTAIWSDDGFRLDRTHPANAASRGKGQVIAEHYPRYRHQEFLRFLRRLDGEFPPPTSLHLILDNYAIHGHARVRTCHGRRVTLLSRTFQPVDSLFLEFAGQFPSK